MGEEKCLNCGEDVNTEIYQIDPLGNYVNCPECGASFDIENQS